LEKPKNAWTALRLVRVGQMLTMSVLVVSIEMPMGVTIKPKNSNLLSVEQPLLGFGVQVILMKMLQDVLDMDLMIFQ